MKLPFRGWGFRLQAIGTVAICALAIAFAAPNLFSRERVAAWPTWLPKAQVDLGIEFGGGTSLLLDADIEPLLDEALRDARNELRTTLRERRIQYEDLRQIPRGVSFEATRQEDRPAALKAADAVASTWRLPIDGTPRIGVALSSYGPITLRLLDTAVEDMRRRALFDSVVRLRRRMKCLGHENYSLSREGDRLRLIIRDPSKSPEGGSRCHHI